MSWLLKINRPPHRFFCLYRNCDQDEQYPDCDNRCGKRDTLYEDWKKHADKKVRKP